MQDKQQTAEGLWRAAGGEDPEAGAGVPSWPGRRLTLTLPNSWEGILFERMQLPHGKKTKTGYSTAAVEGAAESSYSDDSEYVADQAECCMLGAGWFYPGGWQNSWKIQPDHYGNGTYRQHRARICRMFQFRMELRRLFGRCLCQRRAMYL